MTAFGQPASIGDGFLSGRDRAGSAGLTALVYAAILAFLLLLPDTPEPEETPAESLVMVDIPPPPQPQPEPSEAAPQPDPAPRLDAEPEPPSPLDIEPLAAPAPILPPIVLNIPDPVSPGEDSSGVGSVGDGLARAGDGTGNGTRDGTGGTGTGGGGGTGQLIRTGEWVRDPSPRDFNPPPNMIRGAPREGWGEIICVSARNDRLTDCVTHDEFPAESGFSEAMRKASRRFRFAVRDDDGEAVVGQRVLVHLNFHPPN